MHDNLNLAAVFYTPLADTDWVDTLARALQDELENCQVQTRKLKDTAPMIPPRNLALTATADAGASLAVQDDTKCNFFFRCPYEELKAHGLGDTESLVRLHNSICCSGKTLVFEEAAYASVQAKHSGNIHYQGSSRVTIPVNPELGPMVLIDPEQLAHNETEIVKFLNDLKPSLVVSSGSYKVKSLAMQWVSIEAGARPFRPVQHISEVVVYLGNHDWLPSCLGPVSVHNSGGLILEAVSGAGTGSFMDEDFVFHLSDEKSYSEMLRTVKTLSRRQTLNRVWSSWQKDCIYDYMDSSFPAKTDSILKILNEGQS